MLVKQKLLECVASCESFSCWNCLGHIGVGDGLRGARPP